MPEATSERRPRDTPELRALRAGRATLAELAGEYALFNCGCLHTHGRLDADPVAEFVGTHPDPDCTVLTLELPDPVFVGIATPGRRTLPYDHLLHACPHRFWRALHARLAALAFVDRARRRFGRATTQTVWAVDQRALARHAVLPATVPRVTVTAIGVDATDVHVGFCTREDRPYLPALVVHRPLNPRTLAMGQALLADPQDRPFRPIEEELNLERIRSAGPPPAALHDGRDDD